MAEEQKQACNRTPFENTSSCDRGSVDIFTFSNLPVCNIIDPPIPLVGPPAVDFPVIPFTPPPCACINIKTKTSGKIEDREKLKFNATFTADGDCCEGNYTEKFDIKIPCIAFDLVNGNKNHAIDIQTNACGDDTPPTGTFNLGITKYKCQLRVNPEIKLRIPKPPKYEFDTGLKLETACSIENAEGSFYLIKTGDACNRNIKAQLDLKVPKPKEYTFKTNLELHTDCGIDNAYGDFSIAEEQNECGTDFTANLDLTVPKPTKYKFETSCKIRKVCYSSSWISYGSSSPTGKKFFWVTEKGDECEKTLIQHLKIDIPCIQFKMSGVNSSHEIEIKYIKSSSSPTGTINLDASIECCKIKFNPKIKLKIPNPKAKQYEFSNDLNLTTQCGTGNATGKFYTTKTQKDGVYHVKNRLELNIPTPPTYDVHIDPEFTEWRGGYQLTDEDLEVHRTDCLINLIDHLKINVPHVANLRLCTRAGGTAGHGSFNFPDIRDSLFVISGGIDGFGSFSLGAIEDSFGYVTGICPSIKLTMPCPLDKLKLSGDSEKESQPYVVAEKDTPSSSGCAAKWKTKLKMPSGVYTGDIKVLTGFTFNGNRFTPQIGTFKFKNGLLFDYTGDTPLINVNFAKHTCC